MIVFCSDAKNGSGKGNVMEKRQPFSKRHGYFGTPKEITIREDAPENLRYFLLQTACELGLRPTPLREVVCGVGTCQ